MIKFLEREKTSHYLIYIGMALFILGIVIFSWKDTLWNLDQPINSEKVAQLGDFVGGMVGSLWALAGVILFYKALKEQRVDFSNNYQALELQVAALNQQIEEFQKNREEAKLTRRVYEEQSKTSKQQQFDSMFFPLVNVLLKVKSSLTDNNDNIFDNLITILQEDIDSSLDPNNMHNQYIEKYAKLDIKKSSQLFQYYRTLYRAVRVIDINQHLSEHDKFFYSKIIRSQLSDSELILLFYNSYTYQGQKFKKLILKYNLLKHLPLFKKEEFKSLATDDNLASLTAIFSAFNLFLEVNLSKLYDVENTDDKIEEKLEGFDAISGLYFDDPIKLTITFESGISAVLIDINNENFIKIFEQYTYFKLVSQPFNKSEDITFVSSFTKKAIAETYCIEINTVSTVSIAKDRTE